MEQKKAHPNALRDPEAAAYIGMSESWLRQSRMRGNPDSPPWIRIGRSVRYLRSDLDIWLAEKRTVSQGLPS